MQNMEAERSMNRCSHNYQMALTLKDIPIIFTDRSSRFKIILFITFISALVVLKSTSVHQKIYQFAWYNVNNSNNFNKSNTVTKINKQLVLTKTRLVSSVNCAKIFNGNMMEIQTAKSLENDYLNVLTPDAHLEMAHNCQTFLQKRQYITVNLSQEEVEFPLGYSIVVYKAINQFERLLRSIYRPQNVYCIHTDAKMTEINKKTISAIANCFNNVFISSKSYDVKWGQMSVLQADLICMKDLLKYKKWKYFINLTGQDYPLKTNLDIVRILKAFNGANDVWIDIRNFADRWQYAGHPPDGLVPYKGSVHVVVNRNFVDFAIRNQSSFRLLHWLNRTEFPDETFFTTLNHNSKLHIPGSFKGDVKIKQRGSESSCCSMARYKRWLPDQANNHCNGKYVRRICIPGVADLPVLGVRPELFLNKLYWDYNHYVLDCLEELIYNRTVDGFYDKWNVITSGYENLYFVKNAIK